MPSLLMLFSSFGGTVGKVGKVGGEARMVIRQAEEALGDQCALAQAGTPFSMFSLPASLPRPGHLDESFHLQTYTCPTAVKHFS